MTAHPPLVKPGQVFFLFATWEAIASRLLATNSRLWTHRRNPRNLRQSLLTCWICFCLPRQRTWNPGRKLRIYQKTSKNFLRLAKASWESTAQWFTIFEHVPTCSQPSVESLSAHHLDSMEVLEPIVPTPCTFCMLNLLHTVYTCMTVCRYMSAVIHNDIIQ